LDINIIIEIFVLIFTLCRVVSVVEIIVKGKVTTLYLSQILQLPLLLVLMFVIDEAVTLAEIVEK